MRAERPGRYSAAARNARGARWPSRHAVQCAHGAAFEGGTFFHMIGYLVVR
jgi:hypothetical protein